MSDFDKMTVLLPSDLVRAVRAAVDGKRYAAENDVLIDALQDWEVKQRLRAEKLERLRVLVQRGSIPALRRSHMTRSRRSSERAAQYLQRAMPPNERRAVGHQPHGESTN